MTKKEFKEALLKIIREETTSAGAGGYDTLPAFNPDKNAQGTSRNYYLKMGFKLVNQDKLRRQAKSYEPKNLWKK